MRSKEFLPELSTELLARYKKASSADAKQSDSDGNYSRGDKRFKGINKATSKQFDNDLKKHNQLPCKHCGQNHEGELDEAGKASKELCQSSRPDGDLGASNLASCKSQGLRARDGEKSHKLGKGPESRIKVGGHRIKGKKYGGPLPDWS
jgi:hypothetical protein